MTEHCDELIAGTVVLSLSVFILGHDTDELFVLSLAWLPERCFSTAKVSPSKDGCNYLEIRTNHRSTSNRSNIPALSWKDWRKPWHLQSRRFYPRRRNVERVNPATANVAALYPLIFGYLMTLFEQNTISREAWRVHLWVRYLTTLLSARSIGSQ